MKHVAFTGAGRLSHTRQALTDLDAQILIRPDDLTPASEQVVWGEFLTTGNKRGWSVRIKSTGVVSYRFSNDGTASIVKDSTVAISTAGYVDGSKFWLRVVHDVNNGAAGYDVKFYTSDDGVTWTQLGTTVTTATATSIFSDASNVITMGGEGTAASYIGKVYEARLYSTIGGATNLVDPDPWDWSTATYGTTGVTTVTPAIAAAEQDVWPPRVAVTATDLEADDTVTIYRQIAGERTTLRGADAVTPGDTALVRIDSEQPFATSITYVLNLDDDEEYTSSPVTVDLDGGKVALTDAITGASVEIVTVAWPDRRTVRPASRFTVGGRNVVVAGLRPGFDSSIEFFTETLAARDNLTTLLDTATSGVLQYRSGTQQENDCYIALLADTETRFSQDGSDERRRWTLDVVEVEPWASTLAAAGFTYQDLNDAYTGLTYADLNGDYATYLNLAQAEF